MDSFESFKEKLDKEHEWPSAYMFKFVAPIAKTNEVKILFANETLKSKLSKAGNYESFTIEKLMNSSDEVVEIYLEAKKIEGLIVL